MAMPAKTDLRRGDVYWVLERAGGTGGEIRKTRPMIIVSNNAANRYLNRVQAVPLTTAVGKVFQSETVVQVAGRPCKAMADQVMTVAVERVGDFVGTLSAADMKSVDDIMLFQLGLLGKS